MRNLAMILICLAATCTGVEASTVSNATVNLNPGWNSVGLQASQLTGLSSNPRVAGIAAFTGGAYQFGSFSLTDLNAGAGGRRGLWVFATEATSFTYSGTGGPDFVDLAPGYNLVSFCTSADLRATSLTASVNGTTVPLGSVVLTQFFEVRPDNGLQVVDVADPELAGSLKPRRAYWVFASQAARLTVQSGPAVTLTGASLPAGTATAQVRLLDAESQQIGLAAPANFTSSTVSFAVPAGAAGFTQAIVSYLDTSGQVPRTARASLSPGQTTAALGATTTTDLFVVNLALDQLVPTVRVGQTATLSVDAVYLSSGMLVGSFKVLGATFTSSNNAVATVSSTGLVTGRSAGEVTIMATLPNPSGGIRSATPLSLQVE